MDVIQSAVTFSRCFLARGFFSSPKMEAICSSETSVHTYIPEHGVLQNISVSILELGPAPNIYFPFSEQFFCIGPTIEWQIMKTSEVIQPSVASVSRAQSAVSVSWKERGVIQSNAIEMWLILSQMSQSNRFQIMVELFGRQALLLFMLLLMSTLWIGPLSVD
jgi:hypothetical protein